MDQEEKNWTLNTVSSQRRQTLQETLKLAYGEDSNLIKDKRIAAVQALSGTGACRLFADFQKRFSPDSQIYIPVPTWSKMHQMDHSFWCMRVLIILPEEQCKEISYQFKVKGHFSFFDMAYQGFASGDPERDGMRNPSGFSLKMFT
ncbi:hypothetical protein OSB04_027262 [Centaurea solstitialis]|uniref:Aminotransferase class I/classII large domain-containing protein n=1 Tax=Centaurea solstitialis TaxID=347529 RepID=A0AA38WA30_9ASTR|nr:hypothetical protein OSB04_027262 [Centaurea solstitialis]